MLNVCALELITGACPVHDWWKWTTCNTGAGQKTQTALLTHSWALLMPHPLVYVVLPLKRIPLCYKMFALKHWIVQCWMKDSSDHDAPLVLWTPVNLLKNRDMLLFLMRDRQPQQPQGRTPVPSTHHSFLSVSWWVSLQKNKEWLFQLMMKHLEGSLRNICMINLPHVFTNTQALQKPHCGEKGQKGCFVNIQKGKCVLLVLQDGSLHEVSKAGWRALLQQPSYGIMLPKSFRLLTFSAQFLVLIS